MRARRITSTMFYGLWKYPSLWITIWTTSNAAKYEAITKEAKPATFISKGDISSNSPKSVRVTSNVVKARN